MSKAKYFLKIPIRHLVEPHEINCPPALQQVMWGERRISLLSALRDYRLESWAFSDEDLLAVEIEKEQP
jgi:hypothetical protein